MELRTLEIHYGGFFRGDPITEYKGGKISYADNVDPDLMSIIEIWDMLESLGLTKDSMIYYTKPIGDLTNGLKLVDGDKAVLEMLTCHDEFGIIILYVVSPVMVSDEVLNEQGEQGEQVKNVDAQGEQGVEDDIVDIEDDSESDSDSDDEIVTKRVQDNIVDGEDDSDSDSLYEWSKFGDSDEDSINDSDFCNNINNVDDADDNNGTSEGGATSSKPAHASVNDQRAKNGEDTAQGSDYEPSEDLGSISSSDEHGTSWPKYPVFNKKDLESPQLKLGMKFASAGEFRTLLRQHAISNGYDFSFVKNEGNRVTVICKKDAEQGKKCGWRVHASWNAYEECFQIKSLQPEHKCGRRFKNFQANSTWIANKYLEQLRDNPKWSTSAMKKTVRRELCIDVSKSQIYRAKRKAKEVIMGSHQEQFMKLWDYCNIIRIRNPGSLAFLVVERPQVELAPVFQRIFVSYDAQIKGLKEGCRPIIGIDGCFLKGPFGGQLISAIGRDGNNQMFPVAIAVVEAELKDSWNWFLTNLLQAIGPLEAHGWTFISDRQKGLVEVFDVLLPGVDHRFCVQHMYNNFKEQFKGKLLKDLLWEAATSYTVQDWKRVMQKIKNANIAAYEWLMKVPPRLWTRSYFRPEIKCDLLCNNMCEAWNRTIMDAREQPIIDLLEKIRRQVMTRFQEKRQFMESQPGMLCPKVQSKLEEIKVKARHCEALWAGDTIFEVHCTGRQFTVNLAASTCECRQWDVTGIPCKHAVSAIFKQKLDPEDFVHKYFLKETYIRTYSHMIMPIPDSSMWPKVGIEPIMPPPYRKQPGRPKKSRKRAADEPKKGVIRKGGKKYKCKKCKQFGHNTRSCSNIASREEISGEGTSQFREVRPPVNRGGRPPLNHRGKLLVSRGRHSATRGSMPAASRGGESNVGRGRGSMHAASRGWESNAGRGRGSMHAASRGGESNAGRGRGSMHAGRGRVPMHAGRGRGSMHAGRGRESMYAGRGRGSMSSQVGIEPTGRGRGSIQNPSNNMQSASSSQVGSEPTGRGRGSMQYPSNIGVPATRSFTNRACGASGASGALGGASNSNEESVIIRLGQGIASRRPYGTGVIKRRIGEPTQESTSKPT